MTKETFERAIEIDSRLKEVEALLKLLFLYTPIIGDDNLKLNIVITDTDTKKYSELIIPECLKLAMYKIMSELTEKAKDDLYKQFEEL